MQIPPFSLGYWWTIGLEIEAGWVKEPCSITFLGDRFWLRPGAEAASAGSSPPMPPALPDISIAAPNTTNGNDYLHRVRRFLSLLSWFDDRRINESTNVGSGGPNPCRVGNAMASNMKPHYATDMEMQIEMLPAVPSPEAWLGLALYRESLGLNSVAYKVLGFLKIINIRYSDGQSQKKYINSALPFLSGYFSAPRLSVLRQQHSDVGAYLYESCRCAVAHASTQPLVNPDNTDDVARLNADVNLIKDLSRHFLEYELGVKSAQTVLREHSYQTDGFEELLPIGFVGSVTSGIYVPTSAVSFPNVDIRVRHETQGTSLVNMVVYVESVADGRLQLRLRSTQPADALELHMVVDLKRHALEFDPSEDIRCKEPSSSELASAVIDTLKLQKALLLNGILQVYESGSTRRLGRSEHYLPSNIDVRQSVRNLDGQIAALRSRFGL
jgi:hypothetical protein